MRQTKSSRKWVTSREKTVMQPLLALQTSLEKDLPGIRAVKFHLNYNSGSEWMFTSCFLSVFLVAN